MYGSGTEVKSERRKMQLRAAQERYRRRQGRVDRFGSIRERGWVRQVPRSRPVRMTKVYRTWADMRWRCGKHKNYLHVTMCDAWQDFAVFRQWMCASLKAGGPWMKASIDRIDPSKGYNPENCRIIEHTENSARALNTRWAQL